MNIARREADWPSSRVEDLIAAGHEHEGSDREPCPVAIVGEPTAGQVPVVAPA